MCILLKYNVFVNIIYTKTAIRLCFSAVSEQNARALRQRNGENDKTGIKNRENNGK